MRCLELHGGEALPLGAAYLALHLDAEGDELLKREERRRAAARAVRLVHGSLASVRAGLSTSAASSSLATCENERRGPSSPISRIRASIHSGRIVLLHALSISSSSWRSTNPEPSLSAAWKTSIIHCLWRVPGSGLGLSIVTIRSACCHAAASSAWSACSTRRILRPRWRYVARTTRARRRGRRASSPRRPPPAASAFAAIASAALIWRIENCVRLSPAATTPPPPSDAEPPDPCDADSCTEASRRRGSADEDVILPAPPQRRQVGAQLEEAPLAAARPRPQPRPRTAAGGGAAAASAGARSTARFSAVASGRS